MGNSSGKFNTTNQSKTETDNSEDAKRVAEVANVVADVADAVGDAARAVADIAEAVEEIEGNTESESESESEPECEPDPEPKEEVSENDSTFSYIGSIISGAANSVFGVFTGYDEYKNDARDESSDEDSDDEYVESYVAPVIGHTAEGKEMKLREDGSIDVDTSVPGTFFNEMYTNCKVVKLTNKSCVHHGYEFKEGLNVDVNEFKYDHKCGPDGLYFCTENDSENWFTYGPSDMYYVWDVEIPDDARVVVYNDKLKADKFILSNRRLVTDFIVQKIKTMVYTGMEYTKIIDYVIHVYNFITDSGEEDSERNIDAIINQIEENIIDLINIDPAAYYYMPEYLKTDVVRDTLSNVLHN